MKHQFFGAINKPDVHENHTFMEIHYLLFKAALFGIFSVENFLPTLQLRAALQRALDYIALLF